MSRVVSFGSINVDFVWYLESAVIEDLAAAHEPFPAPGETIAVREHPDAFLRGDLEVFHGGKGANQAVAAARAGAETAMLGKVGEDQARYDVLAELRSNGVDTSHVVESEAPTGKAVIFVDEGGENRIMIFAGANAEVDAAYADAVHGVVRAADCLLLQNEVPVATMLSLLASLADDPDRPRVLLDPAPVADADRLIEEGPIDVVTANEGEYAALEPALADFGGTVVRTRGAGPVVVEGEDRFTLTPPAVDPVDTTGAGDVFSGYLAARLGDGSTLADAVREATAAAALSTESEGAQESIPDRAAVERFREAE